VEFALIAQAGAVRVANIRHRWNADPSTRHVRLGRPPNSEQGVANYPTRQAPRCVLGQPHCRGFPRPLSRRRPAAVLLVRRSAQHLEQVCAQRRVSMVVDSMGDTGEVVTQPQYNLLESIATDASLPATWRRRHWRMVMGAMGDA